MPTHATNNFYSSITGVHIYFVNSHIKKFIKRNPCQLCSDMFSPCSWKYYKTSPMGFIVLLPCSSRCIDLSIYF